MKELFVIPCYFTIENPVIFDSIKSIRNFHPTSSIVVVDSGSPDKSYFNFLRENDVMIEDINNKYYDTGAYWHAFKKYKDEYEFFYFFHDSITLKNNLDQFKHYDITSLKYFLSHNNTGRRYCIPKRSKFVREYLFSSFYRTKQKPSIYGFDSIEQLEWTLSQLNKTNYWMPKVFTALFGPVMAIKKEVLLQLEASSLDKILPTNKIEQMAMERVFGIALLLEGYDITKNCILGDYNNDIFENEIIKKKILNRK